MGKKYIFEKTLFFVPQEKVINAGLEQHEGK